MSGFVQAFGTCFGCKRPFAFNPHKVPSLRVDGEREPICEPCMAFVNRERVAKGERPHPIAPDAYDAIPEADL